MAPPYTIDFEWRGRVVSAESHPHVANERAPEPGIRQSNTHTWTPDGEIVFLRQEKSEMFTDLCRNVFAQFGRWIVIQRGR